MGNKYLPLGIGAVVIMQLLFTYHLRFKRCLVTKPFRSGSGPG
jgi:hypothetical protein